MKEVRRPDIRSEGGGPRPETVLVALDGSSFGDSVLPYARALAGALDGGLHLVTVLDPALSGGTSNTSPECRIQRIEAIAWLDRVAGCLRAEGIDASSEVREGSPPEEIVRSALARDARIVAIAARPRRESERLVSRGVAQGVIASGALSLLVTRGDGPYGSVGRSEATIRRIVVGVDGSRASHRAVRMARRLAEHESAETVLAHVISDETTTVENALEARREERSERMRVAGAEAAARYLVRLERALGGSSDSPVRSELRRSVDVVAELQRVADEVDADLLVLGAHGAGTSPCRYGRCARCLLLHGTLPLLLVQDRPARRENARVVGTGFTRPHAVEDALSTMARAGHGRAYHRPRRPRRPSGPTA